MRNIERQIYFYEVKLEKYYREGNKIAESNNYKDDIKYVFSSFEKLPFDKNNVDYSRYLKKPNGTYDFIKVDTINDKYIEGKLINSDDRGLTYYEIDGEIKFLKDTLTNNGSVAEIAHFIIFLDSKIMIFEYNAKSSHSPSLSNYINSKLNHEYEISFLNLINKNRERRFNSLQQVKSFRFTTSSKLLLECQAAKKGFFRAASAALDLTKRSTDVEQKITIEIKPTRITKENKQPYYDADELKESINDIKNSVDDFEKFFQLDIVGLNEMNEQIAVNYTKDILKSGIRLEPEKIDSKDFYEKMHEVYSKIYNKYIK